MNDFNGFLRGQTWSNELAPAREAQHEVLLDETEGDVQVSGHEAFVNVDWRSAAGGAEWAMAGEVAGIVADDAIFGCDLRADDRLDFFVCRCTMEASGDQDRHTFNGNSSSVKAGEERR